MNWAIANQPQQQPNPKPLATAQGQAGQGNLSWYSSVLGAGLTLRYPGNLHQSPSEGVG